MSSDREKSKSQIVSPHERTEESQTYKKKAAVSLKGMGSKNLEPSAELIDVACTIMAIDWKGLSNYGTNGVIEWK